MKLLSCWILLTAILVAQVNSPVSKFEVASVRRSDPELGNTDRETYNNGLLRMSNVTLRMYIRFAYGIAEPQIVGGPKWMDDYRFDVMGKADHAATGPELLAMLQPLLAERFQLRFHHETRTLAGYALTVAKGGIRAKVSDPANTPSSNTSRTSMNVTGFPMSLFAVRLAPYLGKPVADMTGEKRTFDFQVKWSPEEAVDSDQPSIFTALQEQVGLKLEARKVPVDVLVVDSAELPTEN